MGLAPPTPTGSPQSPPFWSTLTSLPLPICAPRTSLPTSHCWPHLPLPCPRTTWCPGTSHSFLSIWKMPPLPGTSWPMASGPCNPVDCLHLCFLCAWLPVLRCLLACGAKGMGGGQGVNRMGLGRPRAPCLPCPPRLLGQTQAGTFSYHLPSHLACCPSSSWTWGAGSPTK